MKQIITLLLIITIQVTFIQKAISLVSSQENNDVVTMVNCKMGLTENSVTCVSKIGQMKDCQSSCEMMSVVSVIHLSENNNPIYFSFTKINYPLFNPIVTNSTLTSIYRPPLFS